MLNYVCQLIMARVLSVDSYGTINTIFSFMMIMTVPGSTLTMIVAKYYAADKQPKWGYLKQQLKTVVGIMIIAFVMLLALHKILAQILAIYNNYVLIMGFVLAVLGYFQPLYLGVFSGNKKFLLVGVYSLFVPLYKIVAVLVAQIMSPVDINRLYIVLLTMIIGTILMAIYGQIKSGKIIDKKNDCGCIKRTYTKDDINTLFLNISVMFYMNIDLLVVRFYGNSQESGLYSAVLLFGRVIYYFATTLGTMLLPSVAESGISGNAKNKILKRALFSMMVFAVVCMIPINILKEELILFLYGRAYIQATQYVIYASVISLALSLFTIIINYVVGSGKTRHASIVMAVVDILLLGCVCIFKSVTTILILIGVIGLLGTGVIYCIIRFEDNHPKRYSKMM